MNVDDLFPFVYADLRRLAARRLGRVRQSTLQPTALVHELFVRMAKNPRAQFVDRTHFFAVAAKAMRAILTDSVRAKMAAKRGAALTVSLTEVGDAADPNAVDALALDVALSRLEALDQRQAQVVELRYFGGLTIDEAADVLRVSPMTVKREWQVAKAWLRRELSEGPK